MENAPHDPVVKAAYHDLIGQTKAHYKALVQAGYKFWFIDINSDAGQDYVSTPWNAMRDMRANQSMGVFPSDAGLGSSDLDVSSNPLLAETGVMWLVGSPDAARACQRSFSPALDAFRCGIEGAGFRAQREEHAWQAHVRLFTGPAMGAITNETRGQNPWVKFGPNNEANQTAQAIDTAKVGLMPTWAWTEGRIGNEPTPITTKRSDGLVKVVPAQKKCEQTRSEGREPMRRPVGPDMMQAILAM